MHPAALDERALLAQCAETWTRASGPGGQHRNKVETAVVLRHGPSGVEARASERRDRVQNRSNAIFRLRLALAVRVRRDVPAGTGPTPLWESRLRGGRVSVNPRHADFPAILAEALDQLAAAQWEPRSAAARLGCTPTQIVKLLRAHPPALVELNTHRERSGRHRIV